jgi:hypothetical protein
MPRLLIVESPATLKELPDAPITIYYDGAPSQWSRLSVSDRVWLNPMRQSPLDESTRVFQIVKDSDGRLRFTPEMKGGET